jgi:hypothetical protein
MKHLNTIIGAVIAPIVSAQYPIHLLAVGDWGTALDPIVTNSSDYLDQQAQQSVGYLMSLAADRVKPQAILGHGDSFYYSGLGGDDAVSRITTTFEKVYNEPSLKNLPWLNVMGNHDYGGSDFICGPNKNVAVECNSTQQLLSQLEAKFQRQRDYKSPNNNRWRLDHHYYKETITEHSSGLTVDIYNVDTNAAEKHGASEICCQCYGYKKKYHYSGTCDRGQKLCANGSTDMYDKCMNKIQQWTDGALKALARDSKASTADWKIVNSHFNPYFHMNDQTRDDWFKALKDGGVQLFINGHTHAENHDFADFKTHFITNGAGGGAKSESMGGPPSNVKNVKGLWAGNGRPYGFFQLSFAKNEFKTQFLTFDSQWKFAKDPKNTVKGNTKTDHCWIIPKDGSEGHSC